MGTQLIPTQNCLNSLYNWNDLWMKPSSISNFLREIAVENMDKRRDF